MHQIREYLRDSYGVPFNSASQNTREEDAQFSIFDSDNDGEEDLTNVETDNFFAATQRADKTWKNVINWWKRGRQHKYPKLRMLARDTLMAMGSSVPSESTFSDSGSIVRLDRATLTDENLRILVTLRSWNRFLGITQ